MQPIRTAPAAAMRSRASSVRSLSPGPAKITGCWEGISEKSLTSFSVFSALPRPNRARPRRLFLPGWSTGCILQYLADSGRRPRQHRSREWPAGEGHIRRFRSYTLHQLNSCARPGGCRHCGRSDGDRNLRVSGERRHADWNHHVERTARYQALAARATRTELEYRDRRWHGRLLWRTRPDR